MPFNSSNHSKTEFNHFFVIYLKERKKYQFRDVFQEAACVFHISTPSEIDLFHNDVKRGEIHNVMSCDVPKDNFWRRFAMQMMLHEI